MHKPIPDNYFEPHTESFVATRETNSGTCFGYGETEIAAIADASALGLGATLTIYRRTEKTAKFGRTVWQVYDIETQQVRA